MMNLTAGLCAAVAIISFSSAWTIQNWRFAAGVHDAQQANIATADTAAQAHEEERAALDQQFKTITVEVEKIVTRDVYHNVCFDSDGLQQLRAAIAAAREPAATVRPAD